MNENQLTKTTHYLNVLCNEIQDRSVGSAGNRQATEFIKTLFAASGWKVEETPLFVMNWITTGASLRCGHINFEVFSSPYSLGCSVEGVLKAVDTLEKLQNARLTDHIVLLHGAIASEQIMPKNFVFYNPDEHRQIVAVLEREKPAAIVCATERHAATAGGVYPFPLFEDGDFDIPSVFMKDTEGEKLLRCEGSMIQLVSGARRISETAFNIVARINETMKDRIVITAHIDAKKGTPGAIDNATGVTVLLLLSDLLKDYRGKYCLEMVAFNGEDYYAVPGQMTYIAQNEGKLGDIRLNINIDGAGYLEGPSCFAPFGLPEDFHKTMQRLIAQQEDMVIGQPWVQGDHSIFVQFGCPAIAVSSNWLIENIGQQDITHTPKDHLGIVRKERILEIAGFITHLINQL